ncbi:MAG: flavin reductase family protein [Burkholderiaceae bacterium]
MYFDLSAIDGRSTYKLMTSTVVPRPIAWVVTLDAAGKLNAAPFSFFGLMSGDPPVICIGVGARAGEPKDTGLNLRDGGEFVVNLVSRPLLDAMNVTAIDFGPEVDELAAAGLPTLPSTKVAPPRIADSPVAFECRTRQVLPIASHRWIIVGEPIAMHIRDDAVLDASRYYVNTAALDLVGRMQGGGYYSLQDHVIEMPRMTVDDWQARQR